MDVFKQRSGQDITQPLNTVLQAMNTTSREQHLACLNNVFLSGTVDFRKSARCQVQNVLLIFFSALLMASIALKCSLSLFLLGLIRVADRFSFGSPGRSSARQ